MNLKALPTPSPAFFLGCSVPGGFYSLYDELYEPLKDWQLTVIKGGPGTGKSSLMKALAKEADKRGIFCERIYCSSDPKGLDAVIFPSLKRSICDGTPPHIAEPQYPGIAETILDLGQFRDDEKLKKHKTEILERYSENADEHKKCRAFLKAAFAFEQDNRLYAASVLSETKLENFTQKFCDSVLGGSDSDEGIVSRRFISAITPEGLLMQENTVNALCEKVAVLEDSFHLAGDILLKALSARASAVGQRVIQCLYPIFPQSRLQGVILPDLSYGCFAADGIFASPANAKSVVHCHRFYNNDALAQMKHHIRFNKIMQSRMLEDAVDALKNAKAVHNELEKYYIDAMDFDAVNKKTEELKQAFFGKK